MTYGCNGAESIYNNADIFLYMYSQITTFNETTLHNFLMLTDCHAVLKTINSSLM